MMSESDWLIGFICLPNSVCTRDSLDISYFSVRISVLELDCVANGFSKEPWRGSQIAYQKKESEVYMK